MNNLNCELRPAGAKGRGVFAIRDLNPGDVIDVVPVLLFNKEETGWIYDTVIGNYYFTWNDDDDGALAMGLPSFFNHDQYPNVVYVMDYENNRMVFSALGRIKANDELTIHYGSEPGQPYKGWWEMTPEELAEAEGGGEDDEDETDEAQQISDLLENFNVVMKGDFLVEWCEDDKKYVVSVATHDGGDPETYPFDDSYEAAEKYIELRDFDVEIVGELVDGGIDEVDEKADEVIDSTPSPAQ